MPPPMTSRSNGPWRRPVTLRRRGKADGISSPGMTAARSFVDLLHVEVPLRLAMQLDERLRDAARIEVRAALDEAVHGHRRDVDVERAELLRERIGETAQRRLAERQR